MASYFVIANVKAGKEKELYEYLTKNNVEFYNLQGEYNIIAKFSDPKEAFNFKKNENIVDSKALTSYDF